MKIAMFTTVEGYKKHLEGNIALYTKAVQQAQEYYEMTVRGDNRASWLKANNMNVDDPRAAMAWDNHIDWAADVLKYEQRKLRKARRELFKLENM